MPDFEQDEGITKISAGRPYLVSFSGIDGAGKTTQIDALFTWLREAGLRVRLLRFWDDIAVAGGLRATLSHKLFKSEQGVGIPGKPVRRRDKNVRGWYMNLARSFLYLLDAARLTLVVAGTSREDADVVIFDRYLHDQLVNLELKSPIARRYAQLLGRVVPQPDLAFLLDADPVAACARKPEYPLEFLQDCRSSYLALAESMGMVTIEAQLPEDVTRSILRKIPRSSLSRATASDGSHQ
jgi:thymidylate kinase